MGDHVFLCYARKDEDFVLKLAANLKQRGAPIWLDQWDIPPSADWDLTIDDALYDCARFLIVLSPAAVGSREVRGELRTALDENKPIVPVLYQKCRIPRQLKLIQHVDFTSSGPDDETFLGQVLRALDVPVPETSEVSETSEVLLRPPAPQLFEPEMILIPAGKFLMGSDPSVDEYARDREQPQHTLYLPDYHLAKTPVTQAQYAAFVQSTGHHVPSRSESWAEPYNWSGATPPKGKENHPVVLVNWHDAVAYCNWLAEITGKAYRLPSEAEWEKGARGTDGRIYPWGDRWDAKRCNSREGGKDATTSVGTYPQGASPYNLLDMAGNVWEWTRSVYKNYPYVPEDGREGLEGGDSRVLRGGSWNYHQDLARCSFRGRYLPDSRFNFRGFRVAASPLFCDDLDSFDPILWHKADWGNSLPPFWNYYLPDHITFADSKMRIRLDDDPCPEGCGGRPYASGEYCSNELYGYGRFEARLKSSDVPGTVTAFFIYTGPFDGNPHDEIDIEILGKDPTKMQTNYIANGVGGHETMIPLGFDASQDFHTYAFEWTPDSITWYVDGAPVHIEDSTRGSLPTAPGRIMMSLWACTGIDAWCDEFIYPGKPVYIHFDWICYTPYVSSIKTS